MANTTAPRSARYKGWFYDAVNGQLEYWYNGTKVGGIDASGHDITNDTTVFMANGVVASAGLTSAGGIGSAALSTNARQLVYQISAAAIASNGANSVIPSFNFAVSAAAVLDAVFAINQAATDVTTGTATSSASYRRFSLICNTASAGTGTDIIASMNATASGAVGGTRGFTIAASTIPANGVVLGSQITVGAATADGTDVAAKNYVVQYHYV